MSGEGGGDRGPDLLASLPAERTGPGLEPAALEELRSGLAALRDEMAGLRRELAAERPAPATREELDAWGARLAERVDAAARPEGTDTGASAEAAGRLDAALARAVDRLSAEIGMMDRRLAAAFPPEGGAEAFESAAARIEEAAEKTIAAAGREVGRVMSILAAVQRDIWGLQFHWRAFLAPWAIFVFVLGMALESRILLLYGWLWRD